MKTKKVNARVASNFMGVGSRVASNDSGRVPNESQGMGTYWGRAIRNPMGTMRDDTLGYRPVSKKQLGTPPKNLV
jgi:hypothetical protein